MPIMNDENRTKMRLNFAFLLSESGLGAAVELSSSWHQNTQPISVVKTCLYISPGAGLPWLPPALLGIPRLCCLSWCPGPLSGARAAVLPLQAEEKERRPPPPFLEGASHLLLSWGRTQLSGMGGGHMLARIRGCVCKGEVGSGF